MDAKLTLKLNQEVIEKAKKYASIKEMSLSKLIENYLNTLTSDKFFQCCCIEFKKQLQKEDPKL